MNAFPEYVDLEELEALIRRALDEDVGDGDVTTAATVEPSRRAEAVFVAKADGTLAGRAVAERVFHAVDADISCTWSSDDGQAVYRGAPFGTAFGRAAGLLVAERVVLNVMQRMSGIATSTRHYVNAVADYGATILDTRKTAPGLRMLDKWAVRLGGGENHRIGLFDMMLIKDNHIEAAGGVLPALEAADRYRRDRNPDLEVEVETRTLADVADVLAFGRVDRILLDNMVEVGGDGRADVSRLQEAVDLIDGRIPTEASGNVTLETVAAIAATGVSFISCGALTHSVQALDISLQMSLSAS